MTSNLEALLPVAPTVPAQTETSKELHTSIQYSGDAQALRQELAQRRSEIITHFEAKQDPQQLLRQLSVSVDEILVRAWTASAMPRTATLIAVGGYGRATLFPHSDVDILILLAEPAKPCVQAALELLIGQLWDIGLELSHSVRTREECVTEANSDITIQTSLVESRFIAGNRRAFNAMTKELHKHLDPQKFFRAKILEQQQRHARFQDTPYSLEPNCKESPGGLRDLQIILWVSRAANLGHSWQELAQRGLMTPVEAQLVRRTQRLLKMIRIRLHLLAGRREDRLVFDMQTSLAKAFNLEETAERRASEVLMQRYYRAAKIVSQMNVIVLQNIEARLFPLVDVIPVAINDRFQSLNGLLDICDEDVFQRNPSALLEAFLLMQQHPELKGMSARTLRGLFHGRKFINAQFRRDPNHRAMFLSLFQQPHGIVHELRRMNQLSILGRYLPAFRRIVGQMQHDLFHVYTVDQHILMVVRNMRRFTMPEFAHEYPLCSRLIANFQRHWLLYIAAFFHDIAKGRHGDHSKLGTNDARRFCRDHSISKEDTKLVVFLVEHHLTMSRIAQKEDMSDPDVIGAFAKTVRDERRLTALYLLTVADIRGTSPKVWNAWKGKLLEDLYFRTLRALGGAKTDTHAELAMRQEASKRILSLYAFDEQTVQLFWEKLDVAWFLRHDAQDIAWITRAFAMRSDREQPLVRARLSPLGEGLQVVVYTPDQPDLLARICEFFDRHRFYVLDARVHTTKTGYALDTFHLTDNGQAHYRDMIVSVEQELAVHIARAAPLSKPSKGRISRQSQNFPIKPTVDLFPDERGQYYLLNMSSADRDGQLYAILRVLAEHKVNVQTAKVTTLGERVENFFLVEGAILSNTKAQIQLETELLQTLSQ